MPVRVVGSRVLRVYRRGVLKPRSTVEGGGESESVKDRARGQAQAEGQKVYSEHRASIDRRLSGAFGPNGHGSRAPTVGLP